MGFIPRSLEYIFKQAQISEDKGYKSQILVSISEIYNSKLIDLLTKEEIDKKVVSLSRINADDKDAKSLTYVPIQTFEEGLVILTKAL